MAAAYDRHKIAASITHQEYRMRIDNDNKDQDVKGRNWDQLTTGTTSVATMGAGSTGDVAGSGSKQADEGFQGKTDENGTQGSQVAAAGNSDRAGKGADNK
jgi:hypothetical protein